MTKRTSPPVDLDLAQAMRTIGILSAADLPRIAQQALSDGYDSASLRQLALTEQDSDAERLFKKSLEELGRVGMSKRDAVLKYARWISARIVLGEMTPYDGAKAIWHASLDLEDDPVPELDPFIYAASESEDRPEDRTFFDEEIKKHALQLVA